MKFFLSVVFLQSIVCTGVCQSGNTSSSNTVKPEQYCWSFAKNKAAAKKPLIDFDAIDNWRTLGGYLSVSNDGKYFVYNISKRTGTRYWWNRPDSLVVQSTSTNWRMAFAGFKEGFFTGDGKHYIFLNGDDLWFLQLGSGQSHIVKDVGSYKTNEENNWLAWKAKSNDSLTLLDLATGKEHRFSGIVDYNFDNSDGWLVCQNNEKGLAMYNTRTNSEKYFSHVIAYSFSKNGKALLFQAVDKGIATLQYLNLAQGEPKVIYTVKEKTGIGGYSIDDTGRQVVFTVVDSTDGTKSGIWYYKAGTDVAVLKLNNKTHDIPEGMAISDAVSFTDNVKYIQFALQANYTATKKPADEMAAVEVWSYRDVYLQSKQAERVNRITRYNAIANIENGKVTFLESSDKKLSLLKGDFAVVKKDYEEKQGDRYWESGSYKDSFWIINLKNGSSRLLPIKTEGNIWFSPDNNWLVYFNAADGGHYFSYNLYSGKSKNISANVGDNQLGITGGNDNEQARATANLAAWINGQTAVLVYDSYDIWKLDLTGSKRAINITNGIGQANSTVFNLWNSDHYSGEVPVIKANEPLLLRAFSRKTKQNGFYKIPNLNTSVLTALYMGGYFMNAIDGCHDGNVCNEFGSTGVAPMKAKNSKGWIVQRQTTNDAANYYATTDFKNFRRLTDWQPQAGYRWMTQELHSFTHLDGKTGQGVLYKPEGFDSTKKYPVMIAFYGGFSNNMYQFRSPTYFDQSMASGKSPAWLLSNGFLVFTPDIAVAPLQYGPKAYSCIEGAAKYLQQLPYVDGSKLAFACHSWSAQLGAYLFTHSTTFSAAIITEGLSFGNMINQALSMKGGESSLEGVELGRGAGNLWDNKNAWLDQTTVLNADKATAAVLLLCNKESSPDYQDQAAQLYTALRRLNKSAWWLKYDNGDHTLHDWKELKDYTTRYTQFLDHYLQNAPAPRWMTQGIPNKLKAIENRYELDAAGGCGKECLICNAWNAQYAKTPEMFKKEINDWTLDKEIADELDHKQMEKRKQLDIEGHARTGEVLEKLNARK